MTPGYYVVSTGRSLKLESRCFEHFASAKEWAEWIKTITKRPVHVIYLEESI